MQVTGENLSSGLPDFFLITIFGRENLMAQFSTSGAALNKATKQQLFLTGI
jgi:hypothetical protein